MASRRKVIFAFRGAHRNMGSKAMRVDQLIEIARTYLDDDYEFASLWVPRARFVHRQKAAARSCRDAIVIFLKNTAHDFPAELQSDIRRSSAGICIDHVDTTVADIDGFADVHIAASWEHFARLKAGMPSGPAVCHLRHHADLVLTGQIRHRHQAFSVGYFGAPAHLVPPVAQPFCQPTYDATNMDAFRSSMRETPLHLCARPEWSETDQKIPSSKPFTKGFNAAAVGANVIVNKSVPDALHYLGDDYPYLIEKPESDLIDEAIARARTDFGGLFWHTALARMDWVRDQVSPKSVARELEEILKLF